MGKSLNKIYLHIVFSTKNRIPYILPEVENVLFNYLGGLCNALKCYVIRVGGFRDHVHILCSLSNDISPARLVNKLKSNSSRFLKTNFEFLNEFGWQNGYAVFSINYAEIPIVKRYIENQHIHHETTSFQEEYVNFLKGKGF